MVAVADRRLRLEAEHARAAVARAEAFVDFQPVICGMRLRPITLWSYNALRAFESPFSGKDVGVTLHDIANFVWIHHPEFGQFNTRGRKQVMRAVYHWHFRGLWRINDALRRMAPLPGWRWLAWRGVTRRTVESKMEDTIAQIVSLVREATRDFPAGEDRGEPLPLSMHAYLINTLRRELGMTHAEANGLSMRAAAQLFREIVHHNSGGKAMMLTDEEAEIWREHLGGAN